MKKIFTLICGLLLMSAFAAKAEEVTLYLTKYDSSTDWFVNVGSSVKTEITKDTDGNFVISDFLDSESPVKFTFEKPAVDDYADITFTGDLDKSYTYPYLLDKDGEYMI